MTAELGLVCGLTNQKPIFEKECPDFTLDETTIRDDEDEETSGKAIDLKHRLSAEAWEKLRQEQHLPKAAMAGLSIGLLAAVFWGIITVITGFQIGFMAIGVGAAVGITVRFFGKGVDKTFGLLGRGISILSVALGNYLSILGFLSSELGISLWEASGSFGPTFIIELLVDSFSYVDILFYGIAVYEGYQFAFRRVSPNKLIELTTSLDQKKV